MAQLSAPGAPYALGEYRARGVSYPVYENAPRSVPELYTPAYPHGEKTFLIFGAESWSFDAVFEQARAIAAALQREGIAPGERVAIAMRNYPEWISAFLGITLCGAVAVLINSWGQGREILHALRDSETRLIFGDAPRLSSIAADLDLLPLGGVLARDALQPLPPGVRLLEDFLWDAGTFQAPSIDPEDPALILYTSGTTGLPKGALSTHFALCQGIYNFECSNAYMAMANPAVVERISVLPYAPAVLLTVPLFHVSGLHSVLLLSLRAGRKIIMMHKWDAREALRLIEEHHPTMATLAPSMIWDLLQCPAFEDTDTSSLYGVGGGGAALPAELVQLIQRKLPQSFPGTGYGMTETNGTGTTTNGALLYQYPRSVGIPSPIVAVRVCDKKNRPLPTGECGQIQLKSAANMHAYWGNPEASAATFQDGWVLTGDLGYLNEEACLFVVDRIKDVVIRGGENIYCAELEAAMFEHPAVQEAAVVGAPHPSLGEEPVAFVTVAAGQQLEEEELRRQLREKLAAYKIPVRFYLQGSPLPKNAVGKVLKKDLRATLSRG